MIREAGPTSCGNCCPCAEAAHLKPVTNSANTISEQAAFLNAAGQTIHNNTNTSLQTNALALVV